MNIFSTHCGPFNTPYCESSVLGLGQLNFLLNACSSLEYHKICTTLFQFIEYFQMLGCFYRVSRFQKNVISVWVLTEKSYMFSWILPRLFFKTITNVILIVSLNIWKCTVAYCFKSINPKCVETWFFCGPL